MITLQESILSSTKAGMKPMAEEWLKDHQIIYYKWEDDNTITIKDTFIEIYAPIPDYVKIKSARTLNIVGINERTEEMLKNLPKDIIWLKIKDLEIADFKYIEDLDCDRISLTGCDIKSLKGFPKNCKQVYIGDNLQHFTKKEIKKLVNAKPNEIHTLGTINSTYDLVLGKNDMKVVEEFKNDLHKIKKLVPEIKSTHIIARPNNYYIWIRLDYLLPEDYPHGMSDNSIFLDFKYTVKDSSIELDRQGHLNLTPEDKAGKYKYYALKGFTAPYIDNGGKKFRKTKLNDFTVDDFIDKTIDFIKAVTKAAIEDQGGELNRK